MKEETPGQTGLDEEQLGILRSAFDAFDAEKRGAISLETTGIILNMMGFFMNTDELASVVKDLDEDKSGQLEFDEFVTLSARFLIDEDEDTFKLELKEAFRMYDKNCNGYITTDDLREILTELDPELSRQEVDGIVEEVDEDKSGTVDFDEFLAMMTG